VILWNTSTGKEIKSLDPIQPEPKRIAISPCDEWLAVGDVQNNVKIWNIAEGNVKYVLPGILPQGQVFSLDGKYLAIARESEKKFADKLIDIVQLSDGQVVKELDGLKNNWTLNFSPDNSLVLAGNNLKAAFWKMPTWEKLEIISGTVDGVGRYFSTDNQKLAFVSSSGVSWNDEVKVEPGKCGTKPTYLFNTGLEQNDTTTLDFEEPLPQDVVSVEGNSIRVYGNQFGTIHILKKK
jgi:WD40 repeat protein